MWTIYCHQHIASGRRYIGQTKQTMAQRWQHHVRDAKSPSAGWCFSRAIRDYGPDAFSHRVLETCATVEEANEAEAAWIESFSTRDPAFGFNILAGGRQTSAMSAEQVRARLSAAGKAKWADPEKRAMLVASLNTPEVIAVKSAAGKAQWADPEIAAKNRAAIETARATPEVRAKLSAASKARASTPEARERTSKTVTRLWTEKREELTARIREGHNTPEYIAKASVSQKAAMTAEKRAALSDAAKAQWSDPEKRAEKVAGILASRTPEMIAAISAHHKELFNTPEMKAKMSDVAKARVAASVEERAAMKARPCSKCGSPRVTLKNGTVRCNVCHAKKEKLRNQAKRAMVQGMSEPTEKSSEEVPSEMLPEPFVPVFCPEMTPDLPVLLLEYDGSC